MGRGRGPTPHALAGVSPRTGEVPAGSDDRIAERLKQRLLEGFYPAGRELPKIRWLVTEEHVSPNTLLSALRQLEAENLLHRRGKKWMAGPRPQCSGRLRNSSIVLLLVANERDWYRLFTTSHTSPFATYFTHEIMRHNISSSLVLDSERATCTSMVLHPAGFESVRELIRSLGDRYRGTLVVYNKENKEPLLRWFEMLGSFRRPTVYFDFTNEGAEFTRQRCAATPSWFYRLYLDERGAVRLALETFVRHGHRTIGMLPYPLHKAYAKWTSRRCEIAREVVSLAGLPLELIVQPHTEPFWNFTDAPSPQSFLDGIEKYAQEAGTAQGAKSGPASTRGRLLASTPSMEALLRKGVTGVMALNDVMAREYYFWFLAAGMEIPGRMSLISFDNNTESVAFPISTIDFGFSQLGYLAAHIFIGDIAVPTDRTGGIGGVCRLVDRGSIASPAVGKYGRSR